LHIAAILPKVQEEFCISTITTVVDSTCKGHVTKVSFRAHPPPKGVKNFSHWAGGFPLKQSRKYGAVIRP
jgi:hypothetical protein